MARLKSLPARLGAAPEPLRRSGPSGQPARRHFNPLRKLYSTKRWKDLRLEILDRADHRCQGCADRHLLFGKAPAPQSAIVDHIEPHRGNLVLFWDPANLQAVCKAYHDGEKQRQEQAALAAQSRGI